MEQSFITLRSFKKTRRSSDPLLALVYNGEGVAQDYKEAFRWNSLAAASGHKGAIINRDMGAKRLSSQQLGEAQQLAAKIQYRIDNKTTYSNQQASSSKITSAYTPEVKNSGTGFIITNDGYILICQHGYDGLETLARGLNAHGVVTRI